jgi:hypothetical protein
MRKFLFFIASAILLMSCASHPQTHSFDGFSNSLAKHVFDHDVEAVTQLTAFPFVDGFRDIYDPQHSMTSRTPEEFKRNYDAIFIPSVIEAIRKKQYRRYNPHKYPAGDGTYWDVISGEDMLLEVKSEALSRNMIIGKTDKGYRLQGIAYYP